MTLHTWLASSLVRHFPCTPAQPAASLHIDAALNERFSLQVAMRLEHEEQQMVNVCVVAPEGWMVRVRRVGYVPMSHFNTPLEPDPLDREGIGHIPGYVPDPLFDEESLLLWPEETHAFWISLLPAPDARPGRYTITVIVQPERSDPLTHTASVQLYPLQLAKRRDFRVTHWFYVDALIDWYRTDLFDERFWAILPRYITDVVEHGQDTLYVPVFTPPLDGVKRPSQLLHITRLGPNRYVFDWRDVKRYLDLARACGIDYFEWTHLFTQWGARYAPRIYEEQGRHETLLWPPETDATSETYRAFLEQFLPKLYRFLIQENLVERSFFHLSDEPHGQEHLENYRRARALLHELAPWMTVMDALTEIEFARLKVTDMPIPSIHTALDFVHEGIPCWCYYCCGPRGRYLNRLLDTPLSKIAMHGLLFYRWPFKGFLHWGYNYWYESQTRRLIDPFVVTDGLAAPRGWAYGDPFEVYPGPQGPLDSIRWEVFGESLQDYRLLQTLGVDRDDPRLAEIVSFVDFPKHANWRHDLRVKLLSQA